MASIAGEDGEKRRWRLPEALPALGPVAMRIYVALWSLLLVAAIVLPVVGAWFEFQQRANPSWAPYGISIGPIEGGRLQIGEVIGESARGAGLRRGDRIIAIDGRPVPHISHYQEVRDWVVGPEGKATRFTIAPAAGSPRDVVLSRERRNAELAYAGTGLSPVSLAAVLSISSLAMSLVLVIAAALLFRRRQQPVAALSSIAYLALAATALQGSSASAVLGTATVTYWIQPFGWGCLLLAVVAMPDGRLRPRWTVWIAALVLLDAVIEATVGVPDNIGNIALPILILSAVTTLAFRYQALPPGPQRQQLRWVFLGFAWGGGLLALVLLSTRATAAAAHADPRWLFWGSFILAPLFSLGLAACAGGLLVSMLRYRLYDADAVISRSVTYGALTILLLATFAGTEKVIELLGEAYLGESMGILAGGLGAAAAAMLIVPLHHRIEHWAEKKFRKQLIRLRHGLPLLVGDLRETAALDRIAAAVLDGVTQGVRARHAALLIGNSLQDARGIDGDAVAAWRAGWAPAEHDGLDCNRRDPTFPMRIPLDADGHGRVGWLLLGPRPDGSFYGKDERETLADIADPVARAVQIVRLREEREDAMERALADVLGRLAALEGSASPPNGRSKDRERRKKLTAAANLGVGLGDGTPPD
jgi:hypothetical protein